MKEGEQGNGRYSGCAPDQANFLRFKARIARQQLHVHGELEHGIILSVSIVVSFQQVSARCQPRTGETGQIEIGVAQFDVGFAATRFLLPYGTRGRRTIKQMLATDHHHHRPHDC